MIKLCYKKYFFSEVLEMEYKKMTEIDRKILMTGDNKYDRDDQKMVGWS